MARKPTGESGNSSARTPRYGGSVGSMSASMSNHEMGYVFEQLLRKFNEALNQNPGEHFTPREVIRLRVDLVLMFDTDLASGEGVARTVNDCGCGTGGRLTLTKDRIQQINPQAKVFLYEQQLNPQTWAIARSDRLILEPEGKDAENIKLGSTLSNDPLADKRFDFQFVNPPYGYEWSKDYDAVTTRRDLHLDLRAGFVVANGNRFSNQSGGGDIHRYQSRTLATLRDTLLPKLLSGELSVAALEAKPEAAR